MAGGFALGPLLLVVLGRSGALPFLVCAAIIVAAIAVILPLRHRSAAGLYGMNFGAVRRFLGLAALLAAVVAVFAFFDAAVMTLIRSEEHTSEIQSLMRISYPLFCLTKKQHT